MSLPKDRSHISTEARNPRTMSLHSSSVAECIDTIHQEDQRISEAIAGAKEALTQFIESVETQFVDGGRLIYIGAGTSGRLGVLDASEAPPTFQVSPDRIIGIIAGGDRSLRRSSESREDEFEGAWDELATLNLNEKDTLVGIAAGGTTPYVQGALKYAKEQKCTTAFLVCSEIEALPWVDHMLFVNTGPEVLTGSTRMKAGTATKQVLNMISTTLMIRSGRVYENLMVDLKASNEKLCDRALRIIQTLSSLNREEAFNLLQEAEGSVKLALVMEWTGLDKQEARENLEKNKGRLDHLT